MDISEGHMVDKQNLGEFEEIVLLTVARLGETAYSMTIRQTVEDGRASRPRSAPSTTLERLEQKGFISSRLGEATPERGGRAKRYFKIEGCWRAGVMPSVSGRYCGGSCGRQEVRHEEIQC